MSTRAPFAKRTPAGLDRKTRPLEVSCPAMTVADVPVTRCRLIESLLGMLIETAASLPIEKESQYTEANLVVWLMVSRLPAWLMLV